MIVFYLRRCDGGSDGGGGADDGGVALNVAAEDGVIVTFLLNHSPMLQFN